MAEAMLIGAGLGAGTSMLSGQDPLKGAALGGAMGGATAGFGGAGVASGAGATMPSHLAQTGAQQAASNAVAGSMFGGVGNAVSSGMDGFTDLTGMTTQDLGGMAFNKGVNALAQPQQQQQIQAAPMGQGISRPQVDLSKSSGSLLSSNPTTSGSGGQQLTPEEIQMLKQKGLL